MRLADAGRAGQAEYGDGLVQPLGGDTPSQLLRNSLDGFVLPDHLGANALGEVFGIDRDQVLAALFVETLPGLVLLESRSRMSMTNLGR